MKYQYSDSTQITPHFNSSEFRCKCGKVHEFGISNELVDKLEKLYAALNCSKIIVTSGYRCPTHGKNVGGSGTGQHTLGNAADICCYGQDGQPISSKIVCQKAQEITELLYASGMITFDEYDKLTDLNRRSFSPLYADLLPKTLEKSSNQS